MMERVHKNKSDYGMPDYYKFFTDNNEIEISKVKYNKIITEFNKELQELIIEDNLTYKLPHLRLEISVRKEKRKPRIQNGKLINNVPPDWKATKELWAKDPEAKEKKLVVRYNNSHTSGYVFRIYCKKFKSNMRNRSLLKIQPNRKFKRKLSKRINDPDKDNYDSFLLYKNK